MVLALGPTVKLDPFSSNTSELAAIRSRMKKEKRERRKEKREGGDEEKKGEVPLKDAFEGTKRKELTKWTLVTTRLASPKTSTATYRR